MSAVESIEMKYHGYPVIVREETLTILDPTRKKLFDGRMTLAGARRFIRAYKKA